MDPIRRDILTTGAVAAVAAAAGDAEHDGLVGRIRLALEAEPVVDGGGLQRVQLLVRPAQTLGCEGERIGVAARREVLHGLGDRVRPGGVLRRGICLGHGAESNGLPASAAPSLSSARIPPS